jgi:hypothetical protein
MRDLLFLIGVLVAVLAGALTPIFVLVKSIQTYKLVNKDRAVYILRAGLALGVWIALSVGIMFLMFVYVFSSAHQAPGAATDWPWLTTFNLLTLAYAAVGFGLVRWMMRSE